MVDDPPGWDKMTLEQKEQWIRDQNAPICGQCRKRGRHYVPPSLGEPGFFICQTYD